MFLNCETGVRSVIGKTKAFNLDVGLHQGSALSILLFAVVMGVVTEEVLTYHIGP